MRDEREGCIKTGCADCIHGANGVNVALKLVREASANIESWTEFDADY